jgi:hypothetical protein
MSHPLSSGDFTPSDALYWNYYNSYTTPPSDETHLKPKQHFSILSLTTPSGSVLNQKKMLVTKPKHQNWKVNTWNTIFNEIFLACGHICKEYSSKKRCLSDKNTLFFHLKTLSFSKDGILCELNNDMLICQDAKSQLIAKKILLLELEGCHGFAIPEFEVTFFQINQAVTYQ